MIRGGRGWAPSTRRALFVAAALVAPMLAACRKAPEPPPSAEAVVRTQSALTNADVMGFEDTAGWTLQAPAAPSGSLTRSTTHDQGSFSLQLTPSPTSSNHPIVSAPMGTQAIVSSQL